MVRTTARHFPFPAPPGGPPCPKPRRPTRCRPRSRPAGLRPRCPARSRPPSGMRPSTGTARRCTR
ncbi:hypothetical protein C7C46_25965 [Streptomyces tateyamensis]|uniref:Uncharacterized protein n=1 Tax=Streptomyces tateyamensis TaxID=565073 RepID=A0A2V4NKF5_9ACTN|nr:hypothetical protein C7C46_25965 [Streptomyces tateyamensis]